MGAAYHPDWISGDYCGRFLFFLNLISDSNKRSSSYHNIRYIVEGGANTGVITYTKADGTSTKPTNISNPWRLSVKFNESYTVIWTLDKFNNNVSFI